MIRLDRVVDALPSGLAAMTGNASGGSEPLWEALGFARDDGAG